MKKRIALSLAAAALSTALLPGTASAGQWCERAEDVVEGGGAACRAGLGAALSACSKVAGTLGGHECQLG